MSPRDWSVEPRLKLRHLQLVDAIGAVSNLGSAARRLNMTQPAASRLLSEIEALVGEPIFDRLPRGLSPNQYGEIIVRRAGAILAGLKQTSDELIGLQAGFEGSVALGVVSEPAVDGCAHVLTNMLKTWPKLNFTVFVEPSTSIIRRLLDGEIDIALARASVNTKAIALDYREIGSEEIAFIVRRDHHIARRDGLRLNALNEELWVMEPPGTLLRTTVEAAFLNASLKPPERVINSTSLIFVLSTVLEGGVIGAIPRSVSKLFSEDARYEVLDVDDLANPIQVEPYGLLTNPDNPLSPAARRVYRALQEFYATMNGTKPTAGADDD